MIIRKMFFKTAATILIFHLSPVSAALEKKVTVGIDYGRAEAKKYCAHITNCDYSDNQPKIEIGYNFTKYYGVELGYTSFGTILNARAGSLSVSQQSHALTGSLLVTIPVVDWVSVYGRGGFAQFDTNHTGVVEGVAIKDESGNTPFYGAGVKLDVNDLISIRFEFQNYADLSELPGRQDDVQALFVGALCHF